MSDSILHPEISKIASVLKPNEIENDPEFKAHVYQQLAELQPFLTPESQIAVVVKSGAELDDDSAPRKKAQREASVAKDLTKSAGASVDRPDYALTLMATLGDYRLEAEGRNADLYEALGIAKRKMLQQLDDVYSEAIDSSERDHEIDALMKGELTLH